jgi:hypothetical protein
MNLRTGLVALTLALSSLISVPAFAQGAPAYTQSYQGGYAPAVVVQPAMRAQPPVAPVMVRPAPAMTPAQAAQTRHLAEQRRQTAEFSTRVESQAAQLVAQIRMGVERGTLRPGALQQANTLHAELTNTLRRDTRDGILNARDQQQINNLLQRMTHLEAQFRVQIHAGARR